MRYEGPVPDLAGCRGHRRGKKARKVCTSLLRGWVRPRLRPKARRCRPPSWPLTRTGLSGAPCVKALPIRLETSCPMRVRSQSTGSVIATLVSMMRPGDAVRSSSKTCSRTGSSGRFASRLRVMPPPSRPRAKSRTLSIRSDMRVTVELIISRTRSSLWSRSAPERCNSLAPALIAASGLRRS